MNKLINCKSCGQEVSPEAKACPKCGAPIKKKTGCLMMIVYAFVGVIALAVIGSIISGGSKSSNSSNGSSSGNTSQAEPAKLPADHKVGDTFSSGGVEVTITKVEIRTSAGQDLFKSTPADGGQYVAIQWKYKNISTKPISSFDTPTLHLLDPQDVKYDEDTGASSSYATELNLTEKVLSDLNPGISVTAASIFEVSKTAFDQSKWKLLVKGDTEEKVSLQ
jgi:hypothetical protein